VEAGVDALERAGAAKSAEDLRAAGTAFAQDDAAQREMTERIGFESCGSA
jgi:hypothetical protein